MAITIGTAVSDQTTNATTLTVSINCAGTNRYLAVFLYYFGVADFFNSITYAGVALTAKWDQLGTIVSGAWARGFRLVNPASGANDLIATFDLSQGAILLGGIPMANVDQGTPDSDAVIANGSGATASVVIASAAGKVVWDGMASGWGSADVAAGQTKQWDEFEAGNGILGGQSTEAGAASTTMQWDRTTTSFSSAWGIGAVSVNALAVPATNLFQSLPLMGVGR